MSGTLRRQMSMIENDAHRRLRAVAGKLLRTSLGKPMVVYADVGGSAWYVVGETYGDVTEFDSEYGALQFLVENGCQV